MKMIRLSLSLISVLFGISRIFWTILGRGHRAFQTGKIYAENPKNCEICYLHNYGIFGQLKIKVRVAITQI